MCACRTLIELCVKLSQRKRSLCIAASCICTLFYDCTEYSVAIPLRMRSYTSVVCRNGVENKRNVVYLQKVANICTKVVQLELFVRFVRIFSRDKTLMTNDNYRYI